tara:strand:+ start:358 stop:546 length:189 start_codon:yes stop_codon:yes gene_type:complete
MHHTKPKDIKKDKNIDQKLDKIGIKKLRFTGKEIKTDLKAVGEKIKLFLETNSEKKGPNRQY